VREADEVATEFLGPTSSVSASLSVWRASAIRRFGMDRHAAQKDRLAIQQHLCSARFDDAEADQVLDRILTALILTL